MSLHHGTFSIPLSRYEDPFMTPSSFPAKNVVSGLSSSFYIIIQLKPI